jgi:hypothetical protein
MHKAPASHTVFFAYVRVRAPTRLCQAHGFFSRKESCVYSDTQRNGQCPGEIATPLLRLAFACSSCRAHCPGPLAQLCQ